MWQPVQSEIDICICKYQADSLDLLATLRLVAEMSQFIF